MEHTRLKNAWAIMDPLYIVSHTIAAIGWHQLEDFRYLAECETLSDYQFFSGSSRFHIEPWNSVLGPSQLRID